MAPKTIFLACLASTLYMTGVIWFVHLVHYPLFDRVGEEGFRRYHAAHTRSTTYVVLAPMVVELLASVYLVADRPGGVPPWMAWAGLAAALASWGVTFFLSVPAHDRLSGGFDADVHRRLVGTNAIRLVSWSAHSLILLAMAARMLR